MNKKKVDQLIPIAYDVLSKQEVLSPELRGYISTFGAAITMGSLLAAVAFYSSKGASKGRHVLPNLILSVLKEVDHTITEETLFDYVNNQFKNQNKENKEIQNAILHATIAIKLALNLFLEPEKISHDT
ncbi:type III-B CRISPR module-associated protein Cmr5 [Streptococcus sp. sy018]|uniref:type III-B CRISPR module-associated protein Cmr5 n=1 Tax=Streptococcus sp. sy018 TaxID=2600147 RepID=UPI0011B58705|nr:type III-B CRISPR module-associated protein Cmr5 [Streptococcus sp. sy018]TWS95558.1 hypothetical protein FRX52_01800 [Streptococcus sp. sy018]